MRASASWRRTMSCRGAAPLAISAFGSLLRAGYMVSARIGV